MIFISVIVLTYLVIVNASSNSLDSGVSLFKLEENETSFEQAPWHVSIRINGVHFCSGAIIGNNWVITSAHCVFDRNFTGPLVTIKTRSGSIHKLHSGHIHPGYKLDDGCKLPQNDLGLLRISKNFSFRGDYAPQMIKMRSAGDILPDTEVNVTHWHQEFTGNKLSDFLKISQWLPINDQQCRKYYYSITDMPDYRFCAVNNESNVANPCAFGDLGDPLVFNGKLIGIKSWKMDCTTVPQSPTIFTDVKCCCSWITTKIGIQK